MTKINRFTSRLKELIEQLENLKNTRKISYENIIGLSVA